MKSLFVAAFLLLAAPAQAVVITVTPAYSTITAGDSVSFTLTMEVYGELFGYALTEMFIDDRPVMDGYIANLGSVTLAPILFPDPGTFAILIYGAFGTILPEDPFRISHSIAVFGTTITVLPLPQAVPGPIVGAGLPGLALLLALWRSRRNSHPKTRGLAPP